MTTPAHASDAHLASATEEPTAPLSVAIRLPLDRFALDVEFTTSHRVTGLFGPSGSGKTSVLESIAGLRRATTGRIALGDETWLADAPRRFVRPEHRHIGYVPQDGLLFPHLDVRANLLAGARRARRDGHPLDTTFASVVDLLELGPLLSRAVTTLSGGERQRVALGRALCSGPRLLLLDEPLAALDIPLRRRVLPFLRRVRDEFCIPMLLVSHDPVEVQALCDDLIALRQGAIVARGEPSEVLTDPDVFPLAERGGYENVVPCKLVRTDAETSVVRIGGRDGLDVITPRAAGAEGSSKLLGIPAREVILATTKPEGLSAQNILPSRVVSIRTAGSLRLVRAHLADGVPPLAVEVTEHARDTLHLEPGCVVYLILKTAGCVLYDPEARPDDD